MAAVASQRWSAAELATLRAQYPARGIAVEELLPGRSRTAIYVKVNKLGIRRPPGATNANAPAAKLQGADLDEAIRLREVEKWGFARIGKRFGLSEAAANNAILIALCTRRGFTPAQRDERGRLTAVGLERVRYALKKGLKGVDIQLRLGVSAGCVAEQRRRYNRDLAARGKASLPPAGGGEAYSGAKVGRAKQGEIEALFMLGLGAKKIAERVQGVSRTTIGRVRQRLLRRLRRKGETLPGCDAKGRRGAAAESAAFVKPCQVEAFRALLLDRVPVRRAALLTVIGASTAYRLRDELAAELAAQGSELPRPMLPGRIAGGGYPAERDWPPRGPSAIYDFRALLSEMTFDEAKARWRGERAEQGRSLVKPVRSFEEQLARLERGEIGLELALPRHHLEPQHIIDREAA